MKQDLTSLKFGKLTVLRKAGKRSGHILYECRCECGRITTTKGIRLSSGHTKSCGCYRSEYTTEANKLPSGEASKRYWFNVYKYRAKRKKIDFNLSYEDFIRIVQDNCYYCGVPPNNPVVRDKKTNGSFICHGIDRKNNDLGYVLENSLPCCGNCNISKNISSHDVFIDKAKQICQNHKVPVIIPLTTDQLLWGLPEI